MTTQAKLQALRQRMAQHQLDAWIVPSADPHQTEYMADHWKTRAWLSGFTGSAGTLVVTPDAAGLWTDFRYFLQAEQELRDSGITLFKMHTAGVPTYPAWLKQHLPANGVIGFDGAVFAVERVRELQKALTGKPMIWSRPFGGNARRCRTRRRRCSTLRLPGKPAPRNWRGCANGCTISTPTRI